MTAQNNQSSPSIHPVSLSKCMLIGGGIALALIAVFLLKAGAPNPAWPKFWMIRPLIIVPLAGATGGAFYWLMDGIRYQGSWKKIVVNVVCLLVYIIGLWMGAVLGLDGTMWN